MKPIPLDDGGNAPRTMSCYHDGRWHADELANLAEKLEHEVSFLTPYRDGMHKLAQEMNTLQLKLAQIKHIVGSGFVAGARERRQDTHHETPRTTELKADLTRLAGMTTPAYHLEQWMTLCETLEQELAEAKLPRLEEVQMPFVMEKMKWLEEQLRQMTRQRDQLLATKETPPCQ